MSDIKTPKQTNNPSVTDAPAAASAVVGQAGAGTVVATAPAAASMATTGGQSGPPAGGGGQQTTVPIFTVTAPKKANGPRAGLIFKDGVATTNDAITAHAALELGCHVFDTRTQTGAFDSDDEDVAEKLAERAARNW